MFNKNQVELALDGLVGLRQPYNPDYAIIDSDNQDSRSGYYANDNTYAKVEYIKDSQDYVDISDADFNQYLKNIETSSIAQVCNEVFGQSDFIDRQFLFQSPLNFKNKETLENGFVGYKIQRDLEKNVAINISRVMLNFSGTGDVKILLFNSNYQQPIESKVVTITQTTQIEDLDWTIDPAYGGEYYLGYLTDGLTVEPFKRDYENSNIKSCYTHLYIENIYVNGWNTEELFDLTTTDGSSNNFGINFDVTINYDYTDLIIQNESLFGYAIYLQYTVRLIESYMSSLRSNKNERNAKDAIYRALMEVNGIDDGQIKKSGLKGVYLGEIKRLRKEIDKIKDGYFATGIKNYTLC